MFTRSLKSCLVVASLLLLDGCSHGPVQYTVSGEVAYKGQPVTQGQIFFADAKAKGPTAYGEIKDGHYEVQMLAGEKLVRINSARQTGKMLKGGMTGQYPEVIELLPPKYNSATTLTRTIELGGSQVLDFRLD